MWAAVGGTFAVNYSQSAVELLQPDLEAMPRVTDRISYLFLDRVRLEQSETGIEAHSKVDSEHRITAIPVANLAVLMLGMGSSISTPAIAALARSGTSVVFVGADGLVGYSTSRSLSTSSKWASAQARVVSDADARRSAAKQLYLARFPSEDIPDAITIAALRGVEGYRVKGVYSKMAKKYQVKNFRRVSQGAKDDINVCLNIANSILYGVALNIVMSMSLNPALGIIHEGTSGAFLYDLADAFKVDISIPASFEASTQKDPIAATRRMVREKLYGGNVLKKMFELTQTILEPYVAGGKENLLLNDRGFVDGTKNWGLK